MRIITIFMAHMWEDGVCIVWLWGRTQGLWKGGGDGKCLERSGSQLRERLLISSAPVSVGTADCIPFKPTRVD